ncbi:MAG TPA: alpha/beta hydrolase-fold protein [Polyangia bacterium]|nr:alpha/beta hydrolase-fold protein [Polyangia bacterium]
MNRVSRQLARPALYVAICLVSFACGSSSTPPVAGTGGTTGSGGNAAGGSGGEQGTGGAGGAASGGSSGSGGAVTGTGGSTTGTGGTTVVDGGSADTTSGPDLAAPGLTGTQMDPGTMGDGTVDQPGPYMNAPETVARVAGAPQGTVTAKTLYPSKTAYPGMKFKYSIYVPAQYQAGKRAALMVFQDARHYDGTDTYKFNVAITFDNLIYKGDMPVTIAVMIDPGTPSGDYISGGSDNPTYRSPEYDRSNGTYARFLIDEFLTDVVLPKYDIVQDPDGWAVAGHSSGGSCAFAVAWNRTEKFHKVLTANGSFNLISDAFPGQVNSTTPAKPIRVYLNSGTMDMPGSGGMDWLAANNGMATALGAKKYHYRYQRGTGTHDPPVAALAAFPDSLRWLWRGYKLPWYP